jgi:hypothetical protein
VKESHDLSVMSELRLVPPIALLCLLSSVACREGRALPRPETGDGPKKEKHAKKHDRRDERAERQGHGDKRGKADKDGKKDAASEPLRHPPGRFVTFQGACDASGAIPLDGTHFLLADDEDNVLRVYDAERGGPPTRTYDLSSRVALADPDSEVDLEAATRVGDRGYFLSSHARKRSGKLDPNRFVFFAVDLGADAGSLPVTGRPATSLLDDLERMSEVSGFGIGTGRTRAPLTEGAVNIEGMTAAADGTLWIGFRSPLPQGKAILVRLLNPNQVIEGARARFASPRLLDLGGLGIRSLSSHRGSYLAVAGPAQRRGVFRLVRFDDDGPPRPVAGAEFEGFSPEGLFTPEGRDDILVLSDDGMQEVDGKACKKLSDQQLKRFRGLWMTLPPESRGGLAK